MRVLAVVGTRPNLIKMAPVIAELHRREREFEVLLVHAGQHYDVEMSQIFIEELGMPAPDYALAAGSGSHAQQTARVLVRIEPVLLEAEPDLLLVPGDVNSTLAAALAASKLGVPIAHVEAGLRSFDRTMPEEINRVLTDQLSDLHFTHSPEAADQLLAEGVAEEHIHYVGNTMIDTLVALRERITSVAMPQRLGLTPGSYLLVTLHRPALVDGPELAETVGRLDVLADFVPIVFPVHPRTRKAMDGLGLSFRSRGALIVEPLGYLEFMSLLASAAGVLTDSGGVQEETTYLGIPCFTLRDSTERPVTTTLGTNTLLGREPVRIVEIPELLSRAPARPHEEPPLWDGRAAQRLASVLARTAAVAAAP